MSTPRDAAMPGPPPNEPDNSLLGASFQRIKAVGRALLRSGTKVFKVGVVEG